MNKKTKVIAAVGFAGGGDALTSRMIEDAMAAAATTAAARGIVDQDEILKLKLEARRKVKEGK